MTTKINNEYSCYFFYDCDDFCGWVNVDIEYEGDDEFYIRPQDETPRGIGWLNLTKVEIMEAIEGHKLLIHKTLSKENMMNVLNTQFKKTDE